jgi:hypothetical protein
LPVAFFFTTGALGPVLLVAGRLLLHDRRAAGAPGARAQLRERLRLLRVLPQQRDGGQGDDDQRDDHAGRDDRQRAASLGALLLAAQLLDDGAPVAVLAGLRHGSVRLRLGSRC